MMFIISIYDISHIYFLQAIPNIAIIKHFMQYFNLSEDDVTHTL